MLLRRRPAAVNLGQTKYFHRSSGVPLFITRWQRKENELPCSIYGYVYFSFSFCQIQTMEIGNIKVIHIALLHFRLCFCINTYKHINKLHYTSNLPSFPFLVLTSFFTLHFNALWIPLLDFLRTRWTSSSSRVNGTALSSLWLTDEARKLCFNSHTSLVPGLRSLYQATSL